MLGNKVSAGGQPSVSKMEVDTPLGNSGSYQIVKIYEKEFLPLEEFTNNIQEASGRIEYLNNRSRKVMYMVRKLS